MARTFICTFVKLITTHACTHTFECGAGEAFIKIVKHIFNKIDFNKEKDIVSPNKEEDEEEVEFRNKHFFDMVSTKSNKSSATLCSEK